MKSRILFIGFNKEEMPVPLLDESIAYNPIEKINYGTWTKVEGKSVISYYKYNSILPTFYDYHLIFLRNPDDIYDSDTNWSNAKMRKDLEEKREEIDILLKCGGILCTFVEIESNNNYSWSPTKFYIKNKGGEEVHPIKSCFKKIIEKNDFFYNAHFSETKGNDVILATNIHGIPVSILRYVNEGIIILLPAYNKSKISTLFMRDLIDIIKKNYLIKPGAKSIQPTWIKNYLLPNEKELLKDIMEKEKTIEEYNEIKQILYETGEALVNSVGSVFKKFGFNVKIREKEGLHDIEIKDNGFYGIIEIKGKGKNANIDDLRQLLNWYIDFQKEDETKSIKPIFVINHYRTKNIKERDSPYTEKAIELGKKNGFCLMSAYNLFKIYEKFLNNKIDMNEIKEILNQDGVVNLKK